MILKQAKIILIDYYNTIRCFCYLSNKTANPYYYRNIVW